MTSRGLATIGRSSPTVGASPAAPAHGRAARDGHDALAAAPARG
jgi:hypothetical protein